MGEYIPFFFFLPFIGIVIYWSLILKVESKGEKIMHLQQENKGLRAKIKQHVRAKDKLMMEMKKNKYKMDNITDMEKKIEKYEFVLNIDKYTNLSK